MKTYQWVETKTVTNKYEVKAKTKTEARARQREFHKEPQATVVAELVKVCDPNEVVVTMRTDVEEK